MSGGKYGTIFVETEIILAALNEDDEYIREKLDGLLPGEMFALHTAVIYLEEQIHKTKTGTELVYGRRAPELQHES